MNWTHWDAVAQAIGPLSADLTLIALIVGSIFALTRYRRDVRLRAADLLLKMEEEFRVVVPTCLDFEFEDRYQRLLLPVLASLDGSKTRAPDDLETLARIDRCLRFFFLCTVLNSDLKVEETAIARAYYFYVCVLAEPGKRVELQRYIATDYPRLHAWMKRHNRCMDSYRTTGEWDWTLVRKK